MERIIVVPASHIDQAWKEGASQLGKASDTSGGEITGDQLKLMLSRAERTLLRLDRGGEIAGWIVCGVEQLPNCRVLYLYELFAPGGRFEAFFPEIKDMAASLGCSRVRCAAKPGQARLYRMKVGAQPVYEVLEVAL